MSQNYEQPEKDPILHRPRPENGSQNRSPQKPGTPFYKKITKWHTAKMPDIAHGDRTKDSTPQDKSTYVPKADQIKRTGLLSSPEGCVLLVGVGLALIYTLWLGVMFIISPDRAQLLVAMTATAIMFGRAAAMAFGYTALLGHGTVIPISMILETVMVLIIYPLFVFSWRHLLVLKWLRRFFDRIQKSAEANQDKVRRYGIIGLFAFVWFPFWMTGPVVGSVIGFLMGLPVWINMTVVLAGTYVAIFGWAFFLHTLNQQIASYSPYAAAILFVALIIIIIAGHFLQRTIHENKKSKPH
jgi:uncharacterized membrane protein